MAALYLPSAGRRTYAGAMHGANFKPRSAGVNQRGIRDHNERLILSILQRYKAAPGADLARLAEGLDAAFQLLRDDALTVDTEAVMLDLFADGVADLAPLADRAEALATALAASGPHAEAFRATFPPLALTLLHHAGGAPALLDAGELSSDAQPVGGIGRFVTALRAAQDAAPGAVLTVSAGNQIAPSKALAVSLETGAEFYDVRAVEQVGYDFIGVGSRDLSLSPSLFAVFANDLEPTVPVVNSVIDGTFEQSWQRLRTEGRLANALLTRAAGRRVLVLGAVDPNLDRRTAPRQLRLPDQDTLVATLQARIDEAALAGASVVLLLVDQGSLEADLALGASLSGVDLLLSATPAVLASEDDLLVPGDAVAGPYPTLGTDAAGAPLALVATADRYRYLGRLQAELDSFGVFTQALAPSGPLRILGAPAEDGVEADNTLQTSVLDLLASDLAVLEDATAATLGVDLDAQADALRTGETNFGDLVADAAFAAARSTAFNAGAPSPQVGILDAGSLTSDAVLPAGALTRGALFDLVSSERTLAVFSQVSAAALKALVERGLAVGIIAAQSIGEPGTQLTMRTFHIGGTASRSIEDSEIKLKRAGKVQYENLRAVTNKGGETIVLNRNGEILLLDEKDREIDRYSIPTGATILIEEGKTAEAGASLCTWDPHHVPIITEFDGKVRYEDLVEGKTLKIERDARRKAARRQVIEHKGDLHPQLVIENAKGEPLAVYPIPEKAYIEIDDGQKIGRGELLAKSSREATGTQDITGGLPRVTELFEARRPKDPAIMSEIDGVVELGDRKRGKRTVIVRALGANGEVIEEHEHSVPQGKHLRVHKGDEVRAGEPLVDGPLYPEDILRINGEENVQEYLLGEVQNVYRSQSVTIDDKHIETILSQMMRKVQVNEPGDSEFLPGAVVDKYRFRRENERLRKDRRKPATGQTLLLGITKASLSSDSFISAASFQETTKVLTEAAIAGKPDPLLGLKENVILGHMVPTGTGFRDHYRTRVKKNIDFGEIGTGTGAVSFGSAGMDDAMDEMLSVDAAAAALGVDPAMLSGDAAAPAPEAPAAAEVAPAEARPPAEEEGGEPTAAQA